MVRIPFFDKVFFQVQWSDDSIVVVLCFKLGRLCLIDLIKKHHPSPFVNSDFFDEGVVNVSI